MLVDPQSTRSNSHAAIRIRELLNPSPVVSLPLEPSGALFHGPDLGELAKENRCGYIEMNLPGEKIRNLEGRVSFGVALSSGRRRKRTIPYHALYCRITGGAGSIVSEVTESVHSLEDSVQSVRNSPINYTLEHVNEAWIPALSPAVQQMRAAMELLVNKGILRP